MSLPDDQDPVSMPPLASVAVPYSTGRRLRELLEAAGPDGGVAVTWEGAAPGPKGLHDNIAEFSSFGPTQDGRIKPDIIAPGQLIESAWVSFDQGTCAVKVSSGTSMSTPLVAGTAALVRQYFADGYYPTGAPNPEDGFAPSGPLVKAALLNGAQNMLGLTESRLPLEEVPSFRQGWGRVELASSLRLPGSGFALQVVDQRALRRSGDAHEYCLRVPAGGGAVLERPVKATLVWHDAPGNTYSSQSVLVNDLDLELKVPEGDPAPYRGTAARPDRLNNVEQEAVLAPKAGYAYGLAVAAHKINWSRNGGEGQPYALVVTGPPGLELVDCDVGNCRQCPSTAEEPEPAPVLSPSDVDAGEGAEDGGAEPAPKQNKQKLRQADACECSADGVSGEVNTGQQGCGQHMAWANDLRKFCYVASPRDCSEAIQSTGYAGAAWRYCDTDEEPGDDG